MDKALVQAALELMQNRLLPGALLAHLSAEKVLIRDEPGIQHMLQAERLRPKHVLACWVCRDDAWHDLPVAEFLARRGKHGVHWQEFAIVQQDTVAHVVWQGLFQATRDRRGGTGGTYVLQRQDDGSWLEVPGSGEAWMI